MHLDLVWTLVLESQNYEVVPKAISFLIQCFMSLDEGLQEDRAAICQSLITECIRLLDLPDQSADRQVRVVKVLK
jgi:hypothetical protein